LREAELEKLARAEVAESLRDELKAAVKLERIDYPAERARCFTPANRTGSTHTTRAYQAASSGWRVGASARGS
jgi:hypothetical protein